MLQLFREPRTRLFFVAHAQSSLGTGAGYAGLVLIAYDRYPGAWGITLVLLADFLPATLLGPIFGAAADRWSRRACAVVADVARAAALIAIDAEALVLADGVTFAISAVVLALLPFGRAPAHDLATGPRPSLLAEAREGIRATGRL